ncbi:WhiB family transcriptional regulator [Streptomyces sp. NPDC015684]|uniref:WhiB family transcriptional regulator n=1 Tax=Streptomyces sp. NPDC015684 TaxID=3364963 RepID=UPI0037029A03
MSYTGSVPDTGGRRLDWMAHMACRNLDPELFSDHAQEHEARVVCAVRCTVRAECLANVRRLEQGVSEKQRECVVAGLTAHERWRLDAGAPGHGADKPALVFASEAPACGTYAALLRHLSLGERVDHTCWSAEVRRDRLHQATDDTGTQPAKKRPAAAAAGTRRRAKTSSKPTTKARGQTPHERRIYALWSSGLTDYSIARAMAISVPSVQRVRDRLGLIANPALRKAS